MTPTANPCQFTAMETSTPTGELDPASIEPASSASFKPTREATPVDPATVEFQPSMVAAIREQCSACGVAMASDQRYCVECGERRGPPRVPLQDVPAKPPATPDARRPPRRGAMSVNTTLIAGIGTLLLAMGIGVLIGRSGNNSSVKSPPAQIVTVAGAGAATSGTATQPATSGTATPTTESGNTKVAAKSKSTSTKSSAPPPKVVKVGSPGHGKGYQNGHFTGNFFGE